MPGRSAAWPAGAPALACVAGAAADSAIVAPSRPNTKLSGAAGDSEPASGEAAAAATAPAPEGDREGEGAGEGEGARTASASSAAAAAGTGAP